MNTERVFITYDKGGNELLVYKNNNDQYVDLFKKHIMYTNISPLIPFSTIQHLYDEAKIKKARKRLPKCSIKSLYNLDRNIQLDTNSIYIGKLCRVSDIIETREIEPGKRIIMQNGIDSFIEPKNKYTFSLQTVDQKIILYKQNQMFLDLVDNTPYLGFSQLDNYSKCTLNKMCINDSEENLKPFNCICDKKYDRYVTKKLVLEKFNSQK